MPYIDRFIVLAYKVCDFAWNIYLTHQKLKIANNPGKLHTNHAILIMLYLLAFQ